MAGMYGADVAQLRELAARFDREASALDGNRMTVGNAIQISAWVGPVAVRFRHQWDSQYSRQVGDAAARLRDAAHKLRANAEEQDRASAADGGASVSGTTGGGGSVTGREHEMRPGPTTPADFIRELAGMEDKQDGLRVQKIRGEDGVYRYVVYIHGTGSTKDGGWGGRLGWDNNPSAMASLDNKTLEAIRKQIASQIDDPSAEVAIIGFSQGGMIAQRLADEGSFNTKVVMTYGSPAIQEHRNYGGADVLRLAHNYDIVPRGTAVSRNLFTQGMAAGVGIVGVLGGGDVPPARGTDVSFWAGGIRDGDAHAAGSKGYQRVAEEFQRSTDPKHVHVRESLSRFSGTVVADYD